jgi:hypothetical protein
MSNALDLGPIKARLADTTPGEWKWIDELLRDIPYDNETWAGDKHIPTGNDGALGVQGLFVETPIGAENESYLDLVLEARDDDDDIPEWSEGTGYRGCDLMLNSYTSEISPAKWSPVLAGVV